MSGDLTRRQTDCLDAVIAYFKEHGESPSVRDVAKALGLKSPHPAYRLLYALYDLGYITWETGKTRSIQVLKSPSSPRATKAPAKVAPPAPKKTPAKTKPLAPKGKATKGKAKTAR